MKISIATIRNAGALVVLSAALALAACQTDGTGPSATDAPKAQAASEPAAARSETRPTQPVRPAATDDDGEPPVVDLSGAPLDAGCVIGHARLLPSEQRVQ